MSKRWRQGMAAHHAAMTSYSIKFGKKDEAGTVKRWRCHINASLQRPGTTTEHEEARESARHRAKVKAWNLTQDPDVVWVTVYPPLKSAIFGYNNVGNFSERLAPVARWTRSKGWRTDAAA